MHIACNELIEIKLIKSLKVLIKELDRKSKNLKILLKLVERIHKMPLL